MVVAELNKLPYKMASMPIQNKEPVFADLTLR